MAFSRPPHTLCLRFLSIILFFLPASLGATPPDSSIFLNELLCAPSIFRKPPSNVPFDPRNFFSTPPPLFSTPTTSTAGSFVEVCTPFFFALSSLHVRVSIGQDVRNLSLWGFAATRVTAFNVDLPCTATVTLLRDASQNGDAETTVDSVGLRGLMSHDGLSLQRIGTGTRRNDLHWAFNSPTKGIVNHHQTLTDTLALQPFPGPTPTGGALTPITVSPRPIPRSSSPPLISMPLLEPSPRNTRSANPNTSSSTPTPSQSVSSPVISLASTSPSTSTYRSQLLSASLTFSAAPVAASVSPSRPPSTSSQPSSSSPSPSPSPSGIVQSATATEDARSSPSSTDSNTVPQSSTPEPSDPPIPTISTSSLPSPSSSTETARTRTPSRRRTASPSSATQSSTSVIPSASKKVSSSPTANVSTTASLVPSSSSSSSVSANASQSTEREPAAIPTSRVTTAATRKPSTSPSSSSSPSVPTTSSIPTPSQESPLSSVSPSITHTQSLIKKTSNSPSPAVSRIPSSIPTASTSAPSSTSASASASPSASWVRLPVQASPSRRGTSAVPSSLPSDSGLQTPTPVTLSVTASVSIAISSNPSPSSISSTTSRPPIRTVAASASTKISESSIPSVSTWNTLPVSPSPSSDESTPTDRPSTLHSTPALSQTTADDSTVPEPEKTSNRNRETPSVLSSLSSSIKGRQRGQNGNDTEVSATASQLPSPSLSSSSGRDRPEVPSSSNPGKPERSPVAAGSPARGPRGTNGPLPSPSPSVSLSFTIISVSPITAPPTPVDPELPGRTNTTVPVLQATKATDLNLNEPEPISKAAPPVTNAKSLAQNIAFYAVEEVPDLSLASDIVDATVPGFPFSVFPRYNWTLALQRLFRQNAQFANTICMRSQCAVVVHVQSKRFVRRRIVRKAVRIITRRPGFLNVFEGVDKRTIRVVRRSRKAFSVFVPFRTDYIAEFI